MGYESPVLIKIVDGYTQLLIRKTKLFEIVFDSRIRKKNRNRMKNNQTNDNKRRSPLISSVVDYITFDYRLYITLFKIFELFT